MPAHALSDDMLQQAVEAFSRYGSQVQAAAALGIPRPTLQHRLREADRRSMAKIPAILDTEYPGRLSLDIENGKVVVLSDAHYWPGIITTIHRALVRFVDEFRPKAVIANGDIVDAATASRHASIGWETNPTLSEELNAGQLRMGEIEAVSGNASRLWPLGNHDMRYESRLAQVAPEFSHIQGMHLKDHFPKWAPCWSVEINDDVMVKHRLKGGTHAAYNNAVKSGKTMLTGHLHSPKVAPVTDYRGTRWGVDCGTLMEAPWVQAHNYLEDAPVDWRSAFAVLTFKNGRLLPPQHVEQFGPGQVVWENEVWDV
jgi:predicted phosphodiesterase